MFSCHWHVPMPFLNVVKSLFFDVNDVWQAYKLVWLNNYKVLCYLFIGSSVACRSNDWFDMFLTFKLMNLKFWYRAVFDVFLWCYLLDGFTLTTLCSRFKQHQIRKSEITIMVKRERVSEGSGRRSRARSLAPFFSDIFQEVEKLGGVVFVSKISEFERTGSKQVVKVTVRRILVFLLLRMLDMSTEPENHPMAVMVAKVTPEFCEGMQTWLRETTSPCPLDDPAHFMGPVHNLANYY